MINRTKLEEVIRQIMLDAQWHIANCCSDDFYDNNIYEFDVKMSPISNFSILYSVRESMARLCNQHE